MGPYCPMCRGRNSFPLVNLTAEGGGSNPPRPAPRQGGQGRRRTLPLAPFSIADIAVQVGCTEPKPPAMANALSKSDQPHCRKGGPVSPRRAHWG